MISIAWSQYWAVPCAGRLGLTTASRQAAIMISRFHSASTGSEYFHVRTSPCSVMRISPEKSPGGCARGARGVQNVFLGLAVTDNEVADRAGLVNLFEFSDGSKGCEQLSGRRWQRVMASGFRGNDSGRHVRQGLRKYLGMLPNVEDVQVEAKGANLSQQRVD